MIDTVLLDFWSKIIGLEHQLQALGPARTAMAENLFDELTQLKSADELRHRLAFGNNPSKTLLKPEDDQRPRRTNDDLALIVLANAVSCAREGRSSEEGLNLLDWLRLVAQYGSQSNLFHAHSELLRGLFYQSDKKIVDATTSFKESLQSYEYLPDEQARGTASICAYCLGVVSIDDDEFAEAEKFFQRATESAKTVTTAASGWTDYIEREITKTKEQRLLVDELAKASLEAHVKQLVEEDNKIVSERTIQILGRRALKAAHSGKVQNAVAVASVADWLAKSLAKEGNVRFSLANTALYVNEYATAEAIFQSLLADVPDDLEAQKGFARSLFQQGKYKESKEILEKVVERLPRDHEVLLDLGTTYIHLNELELAQRSLKASLAEDPSNLLAQRALEDVERKLAIQPGVAFDKQSGTLMISEELFGSSDADLGMMITVALLKANPEQAEEILQSLVQTEGLAYAQRVAELAFSEPPHEREVSHFEKAEELFRARRLPEALAEYRLAIEADRDNASAYMGAGDCFYHMGQLNLATAFFEESIAIQPNPSTLRFLGDAHRKAGRTEEAIRSYEQAIELDPNYEIARRQLSILREQSGRM